MVSNLLEWSTTITYLSWFWSKMQSTFIFYPSFHFPEALSHCKYKPFLKSTEFFLFHFKCWLYYLPATKQVMYHTTGISIYNINTFKSFLFEVICLHQHTIIALYHLIKNKKLYEIFAYPSNDCALYGLKLNF